MSRRKYQEKYRSLRKYFPLFYWCKCYNCNTEFRREWGWKAITPPFSNMLGTTRFLCRGCAPTFEKASEYFLNFEWHKKVLPLPPAPPCNLPYMPYIHPSMGDDLIED